MFKVNLPSKKAVFETRYGKDEKPVKVKIGVGDRDEQNWKVEIRFNDVDQIRGFGELLVETADKIENSEGDKE